MAEIDKTATYEIHRPKALGTAMTKTMLAVFMTSAERRKFDRSRQRAGTAGPLMVGGQISKLNGEQVDEVYLQGLLEGANPCYVKDNGHVLIGHFEFVPVKEE